MKDLPFSIFRRSGREYLYVAYKNEQTGEYLPTISTKQETEAVATKTAYDWLLNGIPKGDETTKVSIRSSIKSADINKAGAEFICKELQRHGLLKSFVMAESRQDVDFWEWEKFIAVFETGFLLSVRRQ
ncbi:MAG: hypothetical protein LBV68_05575 [Spirochaetaceae bacterium]|jgi:hypothetical protein|nr:hypothetical protein [Spirochaetaceae bacterium]